MKLSKPAGLMFSGLLLASGGAYAQKADDNEVGNTAASAAQARREVEDRKKAESDAREKLLPEAEALIKNGKPEVAYKLLEASEFERSGEVRFDYLLGVAALDSGKPDKATLAFERVLTVAPNFAGARMDMARAYYQLGDLQRASLEFEAVLKQNPPEAARATIRKYLDAIAALDTSRQTRISSYVEATVGRDSNVNNSTDQSQISIPSLGNIVATLNPTNVKASDNYYGVAAGTGVVHSLDNNWGLYAGADLHQRGYHTQTSFDSVDLGGRAGVMYGTQGNRVRAGMLAEENTLGNARNFNAAGLDTEWAHALDPGNQVNLFGQYLQYRFAQTVMQVNDFNQQVIGAGWQHVLAGGKSVLSGALYYGMEQDVSTIITPATPDGGRIDGAMHFKGLRVGGQTDAFEKLTLFANAGAQVGDYSRVNTYFLNQRADKLYQFTLGSNWHVYKYWTVRPQLDYARNDSNIVIYSYNRTDVSLTLRRDFQ
ncbi:MAG: surface lipoprotein assembly modifier [Gallionella sp.]